MTSAGSEVFHRPELAARLVADLLEPPPASPVRSGLFLAAPRRTGKSTFLIADLVPALRDAGAHVLYLDLWEDPAKDPAQAIVEAVGASVAQEREAVTRLSKALGRIETVSAADMVAVSLRRSDGGTLDVSLTRALRALSETIERTIVLIGGGPRRQARERYRGAVARGRSRAAACCRRCRGRWCCTRWRSPATRTLPSMPARGSATLAGSRTRRRYRANRACSRP